MTSRYTKSLFLFTLGLALGAHRVLTIDFGHFYRAPLWRGEPRSAKPFIGTLETAFAGTSAHSSFDAEGKKVPLLALYGPEDLTALGVKPALADACKNFSFEGQFRLSEIQFDYFANLDYGFFGHVHLPIRSFLLSDIRPISTKKTCEAAFKSLLESLKDDSLGLGTISRSGTGDLTILAGWSWSTYDSAAFDFIDTTIQLGALFPTAKRSSACDSGNLSTIMALGQGGGFGIPITACAAVGFLNWLTWGVYGISLFLLDRVDRALLRTSPHQQGFIRIEPDQVRVKPGTLWDITTYLRADHFIRGLSVIIGYSHNQKNRTSLIPFSRKFDLDTVNNDPILKGWSMDVISTVVEYDWSNEDNPYGPRLAFQYNHIIAGKRVFDAPMTGGYLGLDFQWRF